MRPNPEREGARGSFSVAMFVRGSEQAWQNPSVTESSAGSAQQAWPQAVAEERRSCGNSAAAEAARESIKGFSREGGSVREGEGVRESPNPVREG